MKKLLVFMTGALVLGLSSAAFGYTMSCSGYSGCDQCFWFTMHLSNSSSDVFVPRGNLSTGQQEQIDLNQSSITAQTYQGASITPTGNISSYFSLNGGPKNTQWTWAIMNGSVIKKGSIPAGIDYNKPVYGISYVTKSYVIDSSNTKVSGTDATHTECAFFFAEAPTCQNAQAGSAHNREYPSLSATSSWLCSVGTVSNFQTTTSGWSWTCQAESGCQNAQGSARLVVSCQNAQVGSKHNGEFPALSESSSWLCPVGTVANFQTTTSGWSWTCQAESGCQNARGNANLYTPPVADECAINVEPTSGPVSLTSAILCRWSNTWNTSGIVIFKGGQSIDSFTSNSQQYTFDRAGNYSVTCYPDVDNKSNSCSKTITVLGKCGNGIMESGEQCDDNNTLSGDGCNSVCRHEEVKAHEPVCGNGVRESGEQCDDGNTVSGDTCTSICRSETPPTGPAAIWFFVMLIAAVWWSVMLLRAKHRTSA